MASPNKQDDLQWIVDRVRVGIPFSRLYDSHLDRFNRHRITPEIGFNATALEQYSPAQFQQVSAAFARNLKVTFHAPFMDLSAGSPDPDVLALTRHRFEQTLALVSIFQPEAVVCHAGYDWKRYGFMKEQWMAVSLETWSWLGRRLQDAGTRLMLENVYEHDPEDIRPLFENLGCFGVGFCLDTGHQSAFSRAPLERWLEILGPYLEHLHLHDNHGRQDEHLGLGHGTVDFKTLFRYLKEDRPDPPNVTLEPHVEAHVWDSFKYLSEHWPWPS